MSDVKQVKVDNWGIYFLQRLKHFFNRTDYCDLTLQFQDNAQLKVHRLVLSACTEYFELLERTCEMYEDCLVMPDDLQADVVVPIVNFMYTGHLEFRMDLLERLYQTSQILNMPVLSKLLESHRHLTPKVTPTHSYGVKKFTKHSDPKAVKSSSHTSSATASTSAHKRSYSKAFDKYVVYKDKKIYNPGSKPENINSLYRSPAPMSPVPVDFSSFHSSQKSIITDSRPTRYELPEELDTENVFDNSFCSISYTSKPIMIHPDTVKSYSAKRTGLFSEPSSSKKFVSGMSTVDIVECKRVCKEDNIFDDGLPEHNLNDETDMFSASYAETAKDPNQLFDQILDQNEPGPKVTIETKDSKTASNLDHARIISEVLKKYPHLVKSNKSIKLKILDPTPAKAKKQQKQSISATYVNQKPIKLKTETDTDFTYETDVLDSKQAAKLIAMGAENTKGPWICLICGTPGKALHFPSYFKFRRHLVEVHNEKPVSNICEYCGLRSLKRNYLMHHLYAQHGVQPPPHYHFPKCNRCSYIALTEGLLVKHKLTHKDMKNFHCNVCSASFTTSNQLLTHIQNTGHKYSAERKSNLQCIYCLKVFLRETNLYAHIKTYHRKEAKNDCVIDDSDEEKYSEERTRQKSNVKYEPSTSFDNDYEDVDLSYQIQSRPVSEMQVASRKQHNPMTNSKQKILNPGFDNPKCANAKPSKNNQPQNVHNNYFQEVKVTSPPANDQEDEIVVIDNNEYIMRENQLIPRKRKSANSEFIMSDMVEPTPIQTVQQPTTSMEYTNVQHTNIEEIVPQASMVLKKSANINQPIQIVVSNEEEYKALMTSNHPIIFDNSDANKTLAVLTTPHHNTMDTTGIDLDSTQSNEMMIIPDQFPLDVPEAVSTENSNIVVVYSHPVHDQNKQQFQILTTGGIGAQFVQSSAIITQNFETVTTTTPVISAHSIETQVDQHWQNNVQSIDDQQIQLVQETEIQTVDESNNETVDATLDNNLDELPQVHLVPQPQQIPPPQVSEAEIISNPQDVNVENRNQHIEHLDQHVEHVDQQHVEHVDQQLVEHVDQHVEHVDQHVEHVDQHVEHVDQHVEHVDQHVEHIDQNVEHVDQHIELLEQHVEHVNQHVERVNQHVDRLHQHVQQEIIEGQPTNISETPMETVVHVPCESMIGLEASTISTTGEPEEIHPLSETVPEMLTNNENESMIEEPIVTENTIEQPSFAIQEEFIPEQEQPLNCEPVTGSAEIVANVNMETEEQQPEPTESQAYDDIVEPNHDIEDEPPIYAKEAEAKIQNITSEWSEDEYDVAEEGTSQIAENDSNAVPQSQVMVVDAEVEESIENIEQEMKKQMSVATSTEVDGETEGSAVSSQEEDSSSQELQLAPLNDSSVHTIVPNPQAQEKISSLLNDWEDNDSQEENITVNEDIVGTTPEEIESVSQVTEQLSQEDNLCLPAAESVQDPKNDKIKSLVSDWDDDEEEVKE